MMPEREMRYVRAQFVSKKITKWLPNEAEEPWEESTHLFYPCIALRRLDSRDRDTTLQFCVPGSLPRNPQRPTKISSDDQDRKSETERSCRIKKESRQRQIKQLTKTLYATVLTALGSDSSRLFSNTFTPQERTHIIYSLQKNGLRVTSDDFKDIISVAIAYKEGIDYDPWTLKIDVDTQCRPASLNCYDYERLKEEMECLAAEIGDVELKTQCPILVKICEEAFAGEAEEYPGRHLPYDKLADTISAWPYQCMRVMDEELYVTDSPIQVAEMQRAIKKELYYFPKPAAGVPTQASVSQYFQILSDLIDVEYSDDQRTKHTKNVYSQVKGGHMYRTRKNGRRVQAFAVDISVSELHILGKQIPNMIRKHFKGEDIFATRYPVIYFLGKFIHNLIGGDGDRRLSFNKIAHTDLRTANYKTLLHAEIKKKIDDALKKSNLMISAIMEDKKRHFFIPLEIKTAERGRWALVATSAETGRLTVIHPEQLYGCQVERGSRLRSAMSKYEPDCLVGLGQIKTDLSAPCDIELTVTDKGMEKLKKLQKDYGLRMKIMEPEEAINEFNCWEVGYKVQMRAYVNTDLLEELFALDRNAKLIDIAPARMEAAYQKYYQSIMRKPRQRPAERPTVNKYIKVPRTRVEE